MSIMGLVFVAAVVVVLLGAGLIVGWAIGANDSQVEILARRLAAEQRIEAATRATLHAMRDAVRNRRS